MKLKKIFTIFLLMIISLFVFTGCVEDKGETKYEIDMSMVEEGVCVSNFNLAMIKIKVTKANGTESIVPVDETMITLEDFEALKIPGKHEITITYKFFTEKVVVDLKEDPEGVTIYELDTSRLNQSYFVNGFQLSDVRIKATKEGQVSYIDLTADMMSKEDFNKLATVGTHTITVKYKTLVATFTVTIIEDTVVAGKFHSTNPYYRAANGKSGTELKYALRQIISVVKHKETYNDLKEDLPYTDEDPERPGYMKLIYSDYSVRGRWDSATTWNREHVWPQSKGWFSTSGAGADLHHLRPEDPKVNSRRGNKPYSEDGRGGSFVPPVRVRGDLARIIFYLLTRYSESDSYKITNVAQSYDMLLRWNRMDPVDDFERQRNDRSYEIQGNRNPYIDHPEAVDMIWGNNRTLAQEQAKDYEVVIVMYLDNKEKEYNLI